MLDFGHPGGGETLGMKYFGRTRAGAEFALSATVLGVTV